jgi:fumarylacetoacetase
VTSAGPARDAEPWIAVPGGSGFGLDNLPLGVASRVGSGAPRRAHVAIGDHALDLAVVADLGMLDGTGVPVEACAAPVLNAVLAAGPAAVRALRERIRDLLTDRGAAGRLGVAGAVVERRALAMALPVAVGDYVDGYASIHHATNLGRILRPGTEPLLPNWRHLPVAYHGRAGTIVVSGTDVTRPSGLRLVDGVPAFGPSGMLDLELEVGFVVGVGNQRGRPIHPDDAAEHLAGVCLVNDWSARDIQAFEYQPLGPFLGKSFATSMSPWLVGLDALAPFRVTPPLQDPPPAPYLSATAPWGLDLHLSICLQSAAMRAAGQAPVVVSTTRFADMYWTAAQQLAHATANGASTRPGDLFASGTVSGPDPGTLGSLIELSWRGERPLTLPDGTTRAFLLDGDRVVLRGWAGGDGRPLVSLGEVEGTVVGAPPGTEATTSTGSGSVPAAVSSAVSSARSPERS